MAKRTYRFWRKRGIRPALGKVRDVVGRESVGYVYRFWRQHGAYATVRRVTNVLLKAVTGSTGAISPESPEDLLRWRFPTLSRLPLQQLPRARRRLNMVTDSINPPHLYGGVGTAMIFAALLAERIGCDLRIITRSDQAKEGNLEHVLDLAGIKAPARVEFGFARNGSMKPSLDMGEDELFLTTSWWTTWATRQAVPSERIIYLLQEDERMFYPHGDEYLRCAELLADSKLSFLVNTKLLFEHFIQSGFANIAAHGVWFDPSFPKTIFYPQQVETAARHRFLFYARPNNIRNLFYRGLEAIKQAVSAGILSPAEWELCFVGKDIPRIRLAPSVEPQRHENLSWQAYAALVRTVDLGLCLMYTPHPSYPPLDLAASGAVVVTNRFGGDKQSLEQYSKNILCAEPSVEGLVQGIAQGVELARDRGRRQQNYAQNRMLRDWRVSFTSALDTLGKRFT